MHGGKCPPPTAPSITSTQESSQRQAARLELHSGVLEMGGDWLSLGLLPAPTNNLWPGVRGGITGVFNCPSPGPVVTGEAEPFLEHGYEQALDTGTFYM